MSRAPRLCRRGVALAAGYLALFGCGSTGPSSTTPPPATTTSAGDPDRMLAAERQRRSELGAAHRKLEDEQATALAGTCARPPAHVTAQRCTPSCYPAEVADPRAGSRMTGAAEIMHLVCTRDDAAFVIADELGGTRLEVRAVRGRFPKPSKPGSWRAEVEAAVRVALAPELARGDVVHVTGTWQAVTHPATAERLRCVTVSHSTKAWRGALDGCGARGGITCEAAGNAAAHGINVVHYRLAEARRLRAAGKDAACQQAALEAIAIARGMPRWRQYATLNTDQWKAFPRYRTRFDGTLDEDALFARAIELGAEAHAVHAACGGPEHPRTTAADEQSFHTCR